MVRPLITGQLHMATHILHLHSINARHITPTCRCSFPTLPTLANQSPAAMGDVQVSNSFQLSLLHASPLPPILPLFLVILFFVLENAGQPTSARLEADALVPIFNCCLHIQMCSLPNLEFEMIVGSLQGRI